MRDRNKSKNTPSTLFFSGSALPSIPLFSPSEWHRGTKVRYWCHFKVLVSAAPSSSYSSPAPREWGLNYMEESSMIFCRVDPSNMLQFFKISFVMGSFHRWQSCRNGLLKHGSSKDPISNLALLCGRLRSMGCSCLQNVLTCSSVKSSMDFRG